MPPSHVVHGVEASNQWLVGWRAEPIEALDLYRPALLTGKVLRLHYAQADELTAYLDMAVVEGELYVQYWLKLGDQAVEMAATEAEGREVVPEVLSGYL